MYQIIKANQSSKTGWGLIRFYSFEIETTFPKIMPKTVRVYEVDAIKGKNMYKGATEGLYEEQTDEIYKTEHGPVYKKVGEEMYFYIHDTDALHGGDQFGFFVFAEQFKAKSKIAQGERGFPFGCVSRLKLYWKSGSMTPPTIAEWENGKVIAFDYENGYLSSSKNKNPQHSI